MSTDAELQPSEEVDDRQLELAREAGGAYQRAAEYMMNEVANTGEKRREGDYVVGFAQEEAEGMYRVTSGGLTWTEPDEDDNCHLEVIVAAAADGRFLPGLTVRATLEDESGEQVGPAELPFLWHPGLYHYGRNLALPGDGTYDLTIEVEPATFPRHDETNGDRFDEGVEVTFPDVGLSTGRE